MTKLALLDEFQSWDSADEQLGARGGGTSSRPTPVREVSSRARSEAQQLLGGSGGWLCTSVSLMEL